MSPTGWWVNSVTGRMMSTEYDSEAATLVVEVAYALPDRQLLVKLNVRQGTTVSEAIELSGLKEEFPDMEIAEVGVFSRKVTLDQPLLNGDRVEIYRPLIASPREMRKQRAQSKKTAD